MNPLLGFLGQLHRPIIHGQFIEGNIWIYNLVIRRIPNIGI